MTGFILGAVAVLVVLYLLKVATALHGRVKTLEKHELQRIRDARAAKIEKERDVVLSLGKPKKKKTNYLRQCPECPKKFKGLIGLSIHRSKAHGYVSPHNNKI